MGAKNKTTLTRLMVCTLVCSLMTACSISRPELFYREARQQQLQRHEINAGMFPLAYYTRESGTPDETVHVYLGGDGVPWHHLFFVSDDPGPYSPLVLQLMRQDSSPSIFLGRPCYQGMANRSPCSSKYWTSARYSSEVVDSMRIALLQLMERYHYKKLVLIGYSGGGTLAVLLARQLPMTTSVITVAGNLDIDAWTDLHHYSGLSGSINPANQPALPASVRQIHIQGERDVNIPPALADAYLQKQHDAKVIQIPDADHTCCWQQHWMDILELLE